MTIKLLSHDISIIVESPVAWGHDTSMGRADIKTQTIRISDRLSDGIALNTLIHEILHLIANLNDIELSETQVGVIATGLFTLIQDNPELIKITSLKEPIGRIVEVDDASNPETKLEIAEKCHCGRSPRKEAIKVSGTTHYICSLCSKPIA